MLDKQPECRVQTLRREAGEMTELAQQLRGLALALPGKKEIMAHAIRVDKWARHALNAANKLEETTEGAGTPATLARGGYL